MDDNFSKSLKSYLGKVAAYNFINNIIKESNYCTDIMEKHFKKELVMTKKDNKDFKNSTKCWICYLVYIEGDVKVRDHYHI